MLKWSSLISLETGRGVFIFLIFFTPHSIILKMTKTSFPWPTFRWVWNGDTRQGTKRVWKIWKKSLFFMWISKYTYSKILTLPFLLLRGPCQRVIKKFWASGFEALSIIRHTGHYWLSIIQFRLQRAWKKKNNSKITLVH